MCGNNNEDILKIKNFSLKLSIKNNNLIIKNMDKENGINKEITEFIMNNFVIWKEKNKELLKKENDLKISNFKEDLLNTYNESQEEGILDTVAYIANSILKETVKIGIAGALIGAIASPMITYGYEGNNSINSELFYELTQDLPKKYIEKDYKMTIYNNDKIINFIESTNIGRDQKDSLIKMLIKENIPKEYFFKLNRQKSRIIDMYTFNIEYYGKKITNNDIDGISFHIKDIKGEKLIDRRLNLNNSFLRDSYMGETYKISFDNGIYGNIGNLDDKQFEDEGFNKEYIGINSEEFKLSINNFAKKENIKEFMKNDSGKFELSYVNIKLKNGDNLRLILNKKGKITNAFKSQSSMKFLLIGIVMLLVVMFILGKTKKGGGKIQSRIMNNGTPLGQSS